MRDGKDCGELMYYSNLYQSQFDRNWGGGAGGERAVAVAQMCGGALWRSVWGTVCGVAMWGAVAQQLCFIHVLHL